MNRNMPWKLGQCTLNNTDINFYVKLVHVDRYTQTSIQHNKSNKKTKSLNTRRNTVDNFIKTQQDVPQNNQNTFIPQKIISSISLWNHKTHTTNPNQSTQFKRNSINIQNNKYRTLIKRKMWNSDCLNQDQNKFRKSSTQHIQRNNFKSTTKSQMRKSMNKTFTIQTGIKNMRLLSLPDQKTQNSLKKFQSSLYNHQKTKKSIKQLVYYQHERTLKKKQHLYKRLKNNLDKAKFSKHTIAKIQIF